MIWPRDNRYRCGVESSTRLIEYSSRRMILLLMLSWSTLSVWSDAHMVSHSSSRSWTGDTLYTTILTNHDAPPEFTPQVTDRLHPHNQSPRAIHNTDPPHERIPPLTPIVIVVGHTGCGGAIASFAQPRPSDSQNAQKPDSHLMQFLDPLIRFRHTLAEGSDVNDLIRENVKDSVQNLIVSPVSSGYTLHGICD